MTGDLGEAQNAFMDGVAGAARAIWRDGEIVPFLAPGKEFEQCLMTAAAAGAADGLHAEPFQNGGEECAVFAGADESGQIWIWEFPANMRSVQVHRQGQAVVPDAIDDRTSGGALGQVAAILPLESEALDEHPFEHKQHRRHSALMPPGGMGHDGG